MTEQKILKISYQKSGAGSTTNRITLPTVWIREIGITPEDRNVEVTLDKDNKTITITKK